MGATPEGELPEPIGESPAYPINIPAEYTFQSSPNPQRVLTHLKEFIREHPDLIENAKTTGKGIVIAGGALLIGYEMWTHGGKILRRGKGYPDKNNEK